MSLYYRKATFFSPENSAFWLIIAFAAKGVFFLFLLSKPGVNDLPGFIGHFGGDTHSYIEPIENLVDHGEYQPDFRVPGFGVFYLPFYFLFGKAMGLNIVIFLQYVFASISVYLLALSAGKIFRSDLFFHLTFYVFAVSTYSNVYDDMLLSESFATSFFIFALYNFVRWKESGKKFNLIFAGLCLTEVIFLRVVFAPVLGLFVLLIFMEKEPFLLKFRTALWFLLPFIVIDGIWIVRNIPSHHKFVPLTVSTGYPGTENTVVFPLCNFVHSFGGSTIFWDAGAEIRWFGYGKLMGDFGKDVKTEGHIPDEVYTPAFNKDSLIEVRSRVLAYMYDSTLSHNVKAEYKTYIFDRMNRYTASVKAEKKFLYYVKAPLRRLKHFFVHSGTYNLFGRSASELGRSAYFVKIFYSLFYWFFLVTGFAGVFILLFRYKKDHIRLFFPVVILYTMIIHPIILRLFEARYIMPVWPLMLVCGVYASFAACSFFKQGINQRA